MEPFGSGFRLLNLLQVSGLRVRDARGSTLGDEKTLKSNGLIPLYYKSLYGLWTLNPFRVHFVFKDRE